QRHSDARAKQYRERDRGSGTAEEEVAAKDRKGEEVAVTQQRKAISSDGCCLLLIERERLISKPGLAVDLLRRILKTGAEVCVSRGDTEASKLRQLSKHETREDEKI
ncbi:hypothetical protein B296_00028824, partial [Ensete ventricosum]